MSEFKILKQKEIEMLSDNERKIYFKTYINNLKLEEKRIKRELAEKAKVQESINRKKINHAKYLVAGEFLNSEYAISFLQNLAMRTRFTKRHTEDLNLLMKYLGFSEVVKFIPAPEEKKEIKNSSD